MTGFAEVVAGLREVKEAIESSEKRSPDNLVPHEGIKTILSVLAEYNVSGDVTWPLRTIRYVVLFYFRVLSVTYPRMDATEKCHLCRLLVHEACKRHVSGVLDRNEVHKFEFVLKVGEMTERNDISNHADCAMFLPEGSMSISKLRRGYHEHYSFVWLRVHGTIESQMELQTYLRLTTTDIQTQITTLKKEFQRPHENEEGSQGVVKQGS